METPLDTPEEASSGPLDLTPREVTPRRGRRRRPWIYLVSLVVVAGIGFVLFNGLENATTYFYNVDKAMAEKKELGDKRFRMQGNVLDGTIAHEGDRTEFTLAFGGKQVHVVHTGDVPELFQPAIPVVIEGSFVDTGSSTPEFHSDRILVRHDSTYTEKHSGRLKDAESDVQKEGGPPTAGDSGASTP